jgi:two-component sensor histidine kinase
VVVVAALSVAFMVVFYFQRRRIKRQNIQLNDRNQEQRALLQEIHHRVKNNLQYIVSLLNLQAQTVRSSEMTAQIEEIRNRIMTMGVIHQRLYRAQGIQQVDVSVFVQELVANLVNALPLRAPLRRNIAVDAIQVDVDTAIAIGLIINEVITNAVKHAFTRHPAPELSLSLVQKETGMLLTLRDNGPGFQYSGTGTGFGMKLIDLLVRKLNGTLTHPDPNTLEILMRVSNSERVQDRQKVGAV